MYNNMFCGKRRVRVDGMVLLYELLSYKDIALAIYIYILTISLLFMSLCVGWSDCFT